MIPTQQALIERLEAFQAGASWPDLRTVMSEAATALRLAWTPSAEAEEIAAGVAQGHVTGSDGYGTGQNFGTLRDDIALALTRYGREQAAMAYERAARLMDTETLPKSAAAPSNLVNKAWASWAAAAIRALEEQAT